MAENALQRKLRLEREAATAAATTTAKEFKSMTPEQQRADRDKRRRELQVKAAKSRVGTSEAKATDPLVLAPEEFTKAGAARLRAEAATRSKHPSLRSSESASRGQDIYNRQFEQTYDVGEKQAAISNVVSQAAQLPDYEPPKSDPKATREQNEINRQRYEAQYAKQVAEQAQRETTRVQKTVGARQETLGEDLASVFQRQQAKKLMEREQVNPEFTKLSEQEKIMNRFDIVEGQLVERSTPRIPEMISADTGRAPIVDKMSTVQKQAVAGAQREVLESDRMRLIGKEKPLSAGARLYKEQQQRNENVQQEFDQYNSQAKDIRSDVADLANTLGVTRDQELRVNGDGTIDILDKETKEIIDPVAEAERKYQEATDRELRNAQEENQLQEERIRASHSDKNNNLTQQGRRILAKSSAKYQERLDVYTESRTDALEKLIISEKKRARLIETQIEAQKEVGELSIEEQISRQEQISIMGMINDKIDESRDNFGNPTVGFATAKQMVDAQLAAIGGKDKMTDYNTFKAQFQTGGRSLNEALDVAYQQTGNIQIARDFASAIGVPSAALKEQMRAFYEERGFNPDEMDLLGTETDKQMGFLNGNLDDMEAISFIASQPVARGEMLMRTAKNQGTYADNPVMEKWLDTQLGGGTEEESIENFGYAILDGRMNLSNVPTDNREAVNNFVQSKVDEGYKPANPVLTELQQTKAMKMSKDFNAIANTIGIFDVKAGMDTLDAIYGGDGMETATGITDITAVNAFQRMIDPGATVREGDVALIESAVPVFARFAPGFRWDKLKEGHKMPPKMRADMFAEAQKIYDKKAAEFDSRTGKGFQLRAEQAGIPFYLVGEKFGEPEVIVEVPETITPIENYERDKQCGAFVNDSLGLSAEDRMGDTLESKMDSPNFVEGGVPISGGYFVMDTGTETGHTGLVDFADSEYIYITDKNWDGDGQVRKTRIKIGSPEYNKITGFGQ